MERVASAFLERGALVTLGQAEEPLLRAPSVGEVWEAGLTVVDPNHQDNRMFDPELDQPQPARKGTIAWETIVSLDSSKRSE